MAKLLSGRLQRLNVGISSYSENLTTLSVVGISSFSNIVLNGSVSVGGTTGTSGQYLESTGIGVTWASFPTLRTGNIFTAGVAQTSFAVSYNVGFVDVYVNGVRLTDSEFVGTSGTSIVLNESCFGGETVDILAYNTTSTGSGSGGGIITESQTLNDILGLGNTSSNGMSVGVITATSFVGNLTGTATFATTAGVSTNSQGLTGIPNISVGIITVTDSRLQSVSEKSTLVSGNTVSLVYNTGGGNVAICTNPTGAITLNVTGIPTDSSFDNRTINFTVVAIQTAIGYACTTINLNGVSRTIKYPGGVVSVASTSSHDIFNFTGINTIGSGSTTANYQILGMVNGNFKWVLLILL